MRFLLVPLALLPLGCVSAPPARELAAAAPLFEAERFFAGRTEGRGVLKVALSGDSTVRVQGSGRVEPDGTLVLDQLVEREGKAPERRQWRIRKTAPGRYTGTLTDAEGPVTGEVDGNRLLLRYRLKEGNLDARQLLYLRPDGRSALNRMELSRFGIPVAALEETIRKVD